jgi:RNA polymerase sigma-70 factor, ECF subfamily
MMYDKCKQMDEQLYIQMAVKGDMEAFNALVLCYQDVIYRHVFFLMRDEDKAADAAQEAFVKAYCKIAQFRGGSFKAWLLRIATNTALDGLRQHNRHPQVPLQPHLEEDEELESPEWLTDRSNMPETVYDQRELARVLEKMVEALPVHYRLIVNLVDLEGLDYGETAQALDLPLGTVKSRLARARILLRKLLSGYNYPYHETTKESGTGRDDRGAPVQP